MRNLPFIPAQAGTQSGPKRRFATLFSTVWAPADAGVTEVNAEVTEIYDV